MTISINPILPVGVIGLTGVLLAGALVYGSRVLRAKNIPEHWIAGLAVIRTLAIILFLACLLRPTLAFMRTVTRGPDLIVLLDTSRSMAFTDPEAKANRFEVVKSALQSGPLAANYLDRFTVHWFAFDRSARPVTRRDLGNLTADGDATCYADSLSTAWSFYQQGQDRENAAELRACRVLLASDGNDHGAGNVIDVARDCGVPVDTLAPPPAGEENLAASVQIAGVQSSRRVLLGSESRFEVTVRQNGAGQIPFVLTLNEDNQTILKQEFSFPGHDTERSLSFAYQPASVGIKKYTLRVTPRDPAAAVKPSPPAEISVKVESRHNEVLVLDDAWRWEFRFLCRTFEDDPSFSFTGFFARGPGIYLQFGKPDRRVSLAGFPQTRAELAWFDTYVIGDVTPSRWPKALAPALYNLVTEEGKSLIVVASPNIMKLAQVPELRELLPVEVNSQTAHPIPGPVADRVSLEGSASPIFFNPPGAAAVQRWPNLPPLDQIYPVVRKRPAATVLLEAVGQANDYGNLIIAAEHTVGRGRVIFIATDTLWKWQMNGPVDSEGNTPYSAFWQQTLRALQPARLASGNANVWVQPDHSQYTAGQTVTLKLEVAADHPLMRPAVDITVTLPDSRKIPLLGRADPSNQNRFTADFEATMPGQYQIDAALTAEGRPLADAQTVIDARRPEPETADVRIDRTALLQIAAATGGQTLDSANSKTWPEVSNKKITIRQTQVVDLWNNLWLLLALTVVLGLDWLIRLMRGYV